MIQCPVGLVDRKDTLRSVDGSRLPSPKQKTKKERNAAEGSSTKKKLVIVRARARRGCQMDSGHNAVASGVPRSRMIDPIIETTR